MGMLIYIKCTTYNTTAYVLYYNYTYTYTHLHYDFDYVYVVVQYRVCVFVHTTTRRKGSYCLYLKMNGGRRANQDKQGHGKTPTLFLLVMDRRKVAHQSSNYETSLVYSCVHIRTVRVRLSTLCRSAH